MEEETMNEEEIFKLLLKAIKSGHQPTVNKIANTMNKEQLQRFNQDVLLPYLLGKYLR
jgi:hypothetical protein